jgi:hypothetical protein
MAAVLAAGAILLSRLTVVVPSTVQNAQANPCSEINTNTSDDNDVNVKCKFFDDLEVSEGVE